MLRLSTALSSTKVTSLVINDAKTNTIGIHEFPPEAFVFDGMVTLNLDTDSQERRLSIRKMRGTKHVIGSFRFDITESGISVTP
jgi:KaiC/GvpD/RAD55 family RecA-like ATPase